MKRLSTSSNVHESCEKQPAAKRSWGLGSLLHGLAGYVRPKNSNAKEKSTSSVVNKRTETYPRDSRDYNMTVCTRSAINERVPGINESEYGEVNSGYTRNETPAHVRTYESSLSRSSTFSYTQSKVDAGDQQQQRTPLLPRFRRNSRNRYKQCCCTQFSSAEDCCKFVDACDHFVEPIILPTLCQ